LVQESQLFCLAQGSASSKADGHEALLYDSEKIYGLQLDYSEF